jgi:hypothetical protein
LAKRAVISVLMLREDQVIGSLSLVRNALAPAAVEIRKDFATPSALAIPNAWLFSEIASLQERSRPELLRVGPRRPIQTRP